MIKNWPKFTLGRNDETIRINPEHVVAVSVDDKGQTVIYTTGAYQGIPFKVIEPVDYVLKHLGAGVS